MAKAAIFASGNGSNFESIVAKLKDTPHTVCCLICDQKDAYVLTRANKHNVPSHVVNYKNRSRENTEKEILSILQQYQPDFIVLAGFMKILSSFFLSHYPNSVVNIHPSLLPKYPGTHGIEKSFGSGDARLGITIHRVDEGLDSGPIILQKAFERNGNDTLEEVEAKIHDLEHTYYPIVVENMLEGIEKKKHNDGRRSF